MRVNLNVPYSEKEEAKLLGARWDAKKKVWFVVDVDDLQVFSRWFVYWNKEANKAISPKNKKKKQKQRSKSIHALGGFNTCKK